MGLIKPVKVSGGGASLEEIRSLIDTQTETILDNDYYTIIGGDKFTTSFISSEKSGDTVNIGTIKAKTTGKIRITLSSKNSSSSYGSKLYFNETVVYVPPASTTYTTYSVDVEIEAGTTYDIKIATTKSNYYVYINSFIIGYDIIPNKFEEAFTKL